MTDTPLLERATAALSDPTPAEAIVLATIAAADGPRRPNTIAAATPLTSAYGPCQRLAAAGHLNANDRETAERGQNPTVYTLTAETRTALEADAPEWEPDALRKRVVCELAALHYCRDLSAAKSKQLAREIPGANTSQISTALTQLHDEGVVEAVDRASTANWRLVGAGLYTPYRGLTEDTA